ncbi:MAG: HAD family hydrolase [Candidatus Cloacimonetes bacterium]|nr:HAD family hydrolase [Candidatus Cloacimonadota bacterium]MCF7812906.1 HAD family hydrolase [Candidatus Cloacimonadota bacterium]MCF7867118.1 HAD family hydrolase [Candidatus Cloacimonadota bacterium]MCF7882562.1 HAD family hydrolase [Candidatus Cloacimonadota bacterium]
MKKMNNLQAILWDFDGTLVDSTQKNHNVTKRILSEFENSMKFSNLNLNQYLLALSKSKNWYELYMNHFGLSEIETVKAGKLWSKYQLEDDTPVNIFDGLIDVLETSQSIKHGIVSQNSKDNIKKLLIELQLDRYFQAIIGYEEVELDHQKPHPEGILNCLDEMSVTSGKVVYIGDNETDIYTAINADKKLREIKICTIGVDFENERNRKHWKIQPDFIINNFRDLSRLF